MSIFANKIRPIFWLLLIGILLALLTACGTPGIEPNRQLVQRALTLQLAQTQQQLSQQLQLSTPSFKIKRLAITEKHPFDIGNLPAYRVLGTYDLNIQLPGRRVSQQQSPFEVYLQRQKEGKTWRLAVPQSYSEEGRLTWSTYLIR